MRLVFSGCVVLMWKTKSLMLAALAAVPWVLLGCVASPSSLRPEEFNAALELSGRSIDFLLQQGNQKEAIRLLEDMAKRNPDRKEPWARKAKIYFDAGSYAQAITSAEEVLQRDPTDRPAKSIRAVAGLRIAGQSLNDLRSDTELKGSAHSDAVGLVKVMRETLGEDVLVPPVDGRREAASRMPKARLQSASVVKRRSTADPELRSTSAGGNPFDALK